MDYIVNIGYSDERVTADTMSKAMTGVLRNADKAVPPTHEHPWICRCADKEIETPWIIDDSVYAENLLNDEANKRIIGWILS